MAGSDDKPGWGRAFPTCDRCQHRICETRETIMVAGYGECDHCLRLELESEPGLIPGLIRLQTLHSHWMHGSLSSFEPHGSEQLSTWLMVYEEARQEAWK